MNRILFMILVLAIAAPALFAQKASDEITKSRRDRINEERLSAPVTGSLTVADVGDVDSFNKATKFMGVAQSGFAMVYYSCDPAVLLADLGLTLGPDDRCLAVPNPAATSSAIFVDMARITIPGRTVSNIFYMINNHTVNWDFENSGAANAFAQMSYSPRVTLESVALNDPAAIDPTSGLPMNGSFTTTGSGTKFLSQTLVPGFFGSYVESYSRANTLGFSREYFRQIGLSETIINNIYKNPLTIRLGMRVSVRNVPFGQFVYTARLLAN